MHQTTVRFSSELWGMLEVEAAHAGVSVAHYVRDSVLARLAFAAGQRSAAAAPLDWADPSFASALSAKSGAHSQSEAAAAVQAQARLQTARALRLRERAEARRQASGG